MPYGEKLKTIKREKNLTNAEIHKVCNVPLATVTRIFDECSQGGNFETYVSLARGLGFSLDENDVVNVVCQASKGLTFSKRLSE